MKCVCKKPLSFLLKNSKTVKFLRYFLHNQKYITEASNEILNARLN